MNDKQKEFNHHEVTNETGIDKIFNVGAWGARHGQCLLLFFTLTVAYSMRSCMGVALVAMVQQDNLIQRNNYTFSGLNATLKNLTGNSTVWNSTEALGEDDFEFHGFINAILLTHPYPSFKWTKKIQDSVISGFFWGYMILQIPAGLLAHRFGARYLIFGAMAINCGVALILPVASYYGGWVCAMLCRMIQGLSQACIMPSFHTILGKWSPLEERGRLSAIIYGGQALGTVLGLPITGFIASSSLGWPGIFRFYGFLSGTVAVFIWFVLADTPAMHKNISFAERRYIEEALGQVGQKQHLPVPWKKILTHRGVISTIIAHIGNTWGQVILYSEVPAYMDKVMGVNIKANGLLTALPFMVMWFTNFFFSWLTDMLIVKKYMTVTQTRKFANSLGSIPAAIGMVALAYAPRNIYVVETILVLICSFKIAAHVGFQVNHIDIAPNFAGTLMSLSNFVSNLVSSQAPIIAGFILTDVTDVHLWRQIFFISAGLYFMTNLVFVVFGTAELADWNDPQYEEVAMSDDVDEEKKLKKVEDEENSKV